MRTIICSKNRPLQLHALLESMEKWNSDIFSDVHIIHTADEEYKDGYRKLICNPPKVKYTLYWHLQTDFHSNILTLINSSPSEYIMFLMDDIVFYRKVDINIEDIYTGFNQIPTLDTISLRLGKNTIYQYQTGQLLKFPPFKTLNKLLYWFIPAGLNNFNYPLSLDGHIFKKDYILNLSLPLVFHNPNQYESMLAQRTLYSSRPFTIACQEQSSVVNLPINRVQDEFRNKFGIDVNINEKILLDFYLHGQIMDLDSMDFSTVNACHQEIPVKFKENTCVNPI